jgi:hypothetical protein
MQRHGIIDLALVITEKGFLQASTDHIGSDNSSEVGSSISLISASTLPTEARSLKRGNSGGLDFDTDAIPESAKPAFAKLFEAADAAHEQAENLRAAVEAVRNALSSGLVSAYSSSYRLSRLFLSNVVLICLSAEAIQTIAYSLHLGRLGPLGNANIIHAVCRKSFQYGGSSLHFLLLAIKAVVYLCVGLCYSL